MKRKCGNTKTCCCAAFIVAWWLLSGATRGCADGGFFPPYDSMIWEPQQQAFITYDNASGTEELIIQPSFQGDTHDFGWIVPLPSLPELAAADAVLFHECAQLTAPLYRHRSNTWGCSRSHDIYDQPGLGGIDVHDDQTVGIYQALTVSASDALVLTDSLTAWGYLHDENHQDVQAALQYYIDRSWYFVAMKVDTTQEGLPPYGGYWYGVLEPVHFTFESENIVYPLRISAISASSRSNLVIYTCTDHRLTFTGAVTEYANTLTEGEINVIRSRYPAVGALVHEGLFLTKLTRSLTPEEMTADLILTPASTDDEYREVRYTGILFTEGLMLALGWLVVARPWRRVGAR